MKQALVRCRDNPKHIVSVMRNQIGCFRLRTVPLYYVHGNAAWYKQVGTTMILLPTYQTLYDYFKTGELASYQFRQSYII